MDVCEVRTETGVPASITQIGMRADHTRRPSRISSEAQELANLIDLSLPLPMNAQDHFARTRLLSLAIFVRPRQHDSDPSPSTIETMPLHETQRWR